MTAPERAEPTSASVLEQVLTERLQQAGRIGIFTNLARLTLLMDELQQQCLSATNLNFVDYSILRVLQIMGDPHQLSPSRLASAAVRSTGGMTKIIDRLERRSLVERIRDPADRRGVFVHLTPAGAELASSASDAYTVGRHRVLDNLSPDEVAVIEDSITQLVNAFERTVRIGGAPEV